MAKPNRLKEVEQEHGEPLDRLIPRLLKELGTVEAVAARLNVATKTIFLWLQRNGYERKATIRWVKAKRKSDPEHSAVLAR